MNVISITGRLTRSPELTYVGSNDTANCKFTVAVDRRFQRPGEDKQADFFDCVAWQKTAEFVANYLDKGRLVEVNGRMEQDKWEDKETGQKRSRFLLVVDNISFLGPKPDAEELSAADGQPEPAPPTRAARSAAAPTAAPAAAKARPATKSQPPPGEDDDQEFVDPFSDQ